jgi:hypothetical protein
MLFDRTASNGCQSLFAPVAFDSHPPPLRNFLLLSSLILILSALRIAECFVYLATYHVGTHWNP